MAVEALVVLPDHVRLRIVGGEPPGGLERLRALARRLGVEERVELVGRVPPTEVPRALAEVDLLLLPATADPRSARYTSPLKLFEFMATGIPVVAHPAPSYLEILEDGVTAIVADGLGATALADAVGRAIAVPETSVIVGRRARVESRRYSWRGWARRMVELVRSLEVG